MTDKIKLAVSKYLKKKKERVIVDLVISDYNKSNFYVGLVFNSKIEKFKVLFIPMDVVDDNIEEYVCYQFINLNLVNYILETIDNSKDIYKDTKVRDKVNKMIDSYYIEINTHVGKEDYTFKATKYIPKEWMFLYETILILFEHCPNVLHGLCEDIMGVLDDREDEILYQKSIDFDLFRGDLDKVFDNCNLLDVSYLEKVNGMYFCVIDNELVIVDYNNGKNVLNLYCTNNENFNDYFYSCLLEIRKNSFKKFYKLMVVDNISDFDKTNVIARYYLCYGIKNDCFKIIEGSSTSLLPVNKYRDGLVRFIGDNNEELEKIIKDI